MKLEEISYIQPINLLEEEINLMEEEYLAEGSGIVTKSVVGLFLAVGASAGFIYRQLKNIKNVGFWNVFRIVISSLASVAIINLFGMTFPGIAAAGIIAGTALAATILVDDLLTNDGEIRNNIRKIEKLVSDRDVLILEFNKSKRRESANKIIKLSSEIEKLTKRTAYLIKNDDGFPRLKAKDGPLSSGELWKLEKFINAAEKTELVILSNLDRRTIEKFDKIFVESMTESKEQ